MEGVNTQEYIPRNISCLFFFIILAFDPYFKVIGFSFLGTKKLFIKDSTLIFPYFSNAYCTSISYFMLHYQALLL